MERQHTNGEVRGLTSGEVAERVRRGETNAAEERTSRSYGDILRENVFTLFNLILGVLVVVVLVAGSPRDALFGFVVVFNSAVGVVQEVRAKRELDRLQLLSAPRARVLRDGAIREVSLDDVVRDDVVELSVGDQVPADGPVLSAEGLEVDESLLTGESVPRQKAPGDGVMSGSFVVAGAGRFRAEQVGAEAYARRLAAEARRFGLVASELRASVNRILRWVLLAMVPIGVLTAVTQLGAHDTVRGTALATAAALEAMVPQGLVLLTSISFAVSVVALGRRNVLVSELAAVEVLARVDVVCVDKTGTLTESALTVDRVVPLSLSEDEAASPLAALAAVAPNKTAEAIADRFGSPHGWDARSSVPFSSTRKWSGGDFGEHGSWALGAPEVLLPPGTHEDVREKAASLSAEGNRVVLLARATGPLSVERPPANLQPAGLVVLRERIRVDAADTLRYFTNQDVVVKVISGDDPRTVAAVARAVGLDPGEPLDARSLPEEPGALATAMDTHTVFGRVTPEQKRRMVKGLQARGHVVAMTGDGVNDVLALKAADLGIAMGSGAAAARAVARVVLVDGRFATLPGVVAEGRRVIANIERVANLFLTKTVYAVLISLATAALALPYPFLPRHLTVVASLTIGIPGFFLALEPNAARYRPGFLGRVLRFAVPAGIAATAAAFGAYAADRYAGGSLMESRTVATLTLVVVGLWILGIMARPLTRWRFALLATLTAGLGLVLVIGPVRRFFALEYVPGPALGIVVLAVLGGIVLVELGLRVAGWRRVRADG
jgi:cation-transporting ATPase E